MHTARRFGFCGPMGQSRHASLPMARSMPTPSSLQTADSSHTSEQTTTIRLPYMSCLSAAGEPRCVAKHHLAASSPAWSPDSTRLAYVARVPEEGRYGTDDKVKPSQESPRRINTLRYRYDNLGYTIDRRKHIHIVDVTAEDSKPFQLTTGDYDHDAPAWTPDGESILFVAARHTTRDTDLVADIWQQPLMAGVRPTALTHGDLGCIEPTVAADGTVWFRAYPGSDTAGRPAQLYTTPDKRWSDPELHDLADVFCSHLTHPRARWRRRHRHLVSPRRSQADPVRKRRVDRNAPRGRALCAGSRPSDGCHSNGRCDRHFLR